MTPNLSQGAEIADARLREMIDAAKFYDGANGYDPEPREVIAVCEQLLAAREALAAWIVPEGWQTMDSAPRDGASVSLLLSSGREVNQAWWGPAAMADTDDFDGIEGWRDHRGWVRGEDEEAIRWKPWRSPLAASPVPNVPPQVNEGVAIKPLEWSVESLSELLEELRDASNSPHIAMPLADLFGEAFEALTDLNRLVDDLAAAEKKRGAIKSLVWNEYPNEFYPDVFGHCWDATTPFGRYEIAEASASDTPYYNVCRGTEFVADCDGLPEAKAAAQADYEQRIRSALVSPPPSPATAGAGEPVGYLRGSGKVMLEEGQVAALYPRSDYQTAIPVYLASDQSRVERLETALRPFADLDQLTEENGWKDDDDLTLVTEAVIGRTRYAKVELRHFRAARQALGDRP